MIVADAVQAYVRDNERQWSSDRTQTLGASEVGQCIRKVFMTKFEGEPGMNVPPRDNDYVETWGARWRGNLIEGHLLVPALRKRYGSKALLLGPAQQTFVDGYCSATPDCLLDLEPPVVVEFKSIDPRVALVEPKPEHVYQAQMQMGILRARTQYQPSTAIISYTDASFLNETKEFEVAFDERMYEAGKTRAARVMTAESIDELEPEGYLAGGKECDYCPFTRACGVQRRQLPDEQDVAADPQFVAELSDLARKLKYAEAAIDVSEKQKRELQYEIKERLRAKSMRRIVGDGVAISWTAVKGRESWDMPALKEAAFGAGIDIEQFVRVGEGGDRLTVTLKEKKAAA
jgi:hypothetical protein